MEKRATGWIRDVPDTRDYDAKDIVEAITLGKAPAPGKVDGREFCSPIEDQGPIGSCTAQSVVGMAEYLERRLYDRHVDASRLFLYKMARQLDGMVGDTGAQLRTAMKAFRIFGAPPERYWPYDIRKFDDDPPAFVFALGQAWQALEYVRIDIEGRSREECLFLMKQLLSERHPLVLGFLLFDYGTNYGEFAMPKKGQIPHGGHAIMLCGYDDDREIGESKGALLLRNSWGVKWGENGYGWLPYDYILKHLTADIWTLLRKESVME